MRQWDWQQVDLIYLDPPFNSNQQYNILFGNRTNGPSSQVMAFDDTWQWSAEARSRVDALKRVASGGGGVVSPRQ